MTPELLPLFKALNNTAAYFYRNQKKPGLHLIVINNLQISLANEFGVPEVRRQFVLHLFGTENVKQSLSETELLLHQLPVIQYREKKPCSNLPKV